MDCCVIAAINDENILLRDLASSSIFENNSNYLMRNYASASTAYNDGIDKSTSEIMIFAHQDIYFPDCWQNKLSEEIDKIEEVDKNWAVIGVFGINKEGEYIGHCWSTGMGKIIGNDFTMPRIVCSVDELVIVIRRSSGLRFDEKLPGFHLYGTDIVQEAFAKGYNSYVINAPVIHNSKPVISLRGSYTSAYSYMSDKWKKELPINTVIAKITTFGVPLMRLKLRMFFKNIFKLRRRVEDITYVMGKNVAEKINFE